MKLNEISWIEFLKKVSLKGKDTIFGIGDDCSLVKIKKDKILLKSDLFVEDIHFNLKNTNFKTIGMRAVLRVLSDFSACGGIAKFIGLSLGKPRYLKDNDIKEIINGIIYCAKKYRFSFIGGDTSKSFKLFLDIWGVGICEKFIPRNGARDGDYIFVTGKLGRRSFYEVFEPRIKESQYIVKNFKVNSMIDISDGFILDLWRILTESKKGAILYRENLPIEKESDLYRGEDYELIFTVSKDEKNIEELKKRFYFVGMIKNKKFGYKIKINNKIKQINPKGHFNF